MQVGDKIYCKKDYFTQERSEDCLNARRELVFKMRKGVIDMKYFMSDKENRK